MDRGKLDNVSGKQKIEWVGIDEMDNSLSYANGIKRAKPEGRI